MQKGILFDLTYAGAMLANMSDDEQAKFFKGFVKEMMTWPTATAREMQLLGINALLTKEEKELLTGLTFKEEK